jgi:hypothetical protein
LSRAWPAPWGACATDDAYPVSADVRALVAYALEQGWRPAERGGTYVLSERVDVTLPGFLLTDRLLTPDSGDPTLRVAEAAEGQA